VVDPNLVAGITHPDRNESRDQFPWVAVYFHNRLKGLRPSYRRDLIDHRDIIVFSLGMGDDIIFLVNMYSDRNHSAIHILSEDAMDWPDLHIMGGDFNC
jgi:hypothetical protein